MMLMSSSPRSVLYRHFHRIAWLAVLLTACVVVFGAFVRLSDAGLSCPDWPTCYGRATWPSAPQDAAALSAAIERTLAETDTPERAEKLAEYKRRVVEAYSLSRWAERVAGVYCELL